MRVCAGGSCTDWSSGFAIGNQRCQSVTAYADAAAIKVEVKAEAGKTVNCTPTFARDASFGGTAVFHTWGTTLSPKCEQPGGGSSKGQACVYLEPGAGYEAKMQVCKPGASCGDSANCSAWSSSFPIGKTSCQAFAGWTSAGQATNVCLNAITGRTVPCLPSYAYDPNYGLNIVYHATGTTGQPACQVPYSATGGTTGPAQRTFDGVTAAVFDCVKQTSAKQHGTVYTGDDQGTATTNSPVGQVVLGYAFNSSQSTITYTIQKKPGIVSDSEIWNGIQNTIDQCQKQG